MFQIDYILGRQAYDGKTDSEVCTRIYTCSCLQCTVTTVVCQQ
uniref:Uncharacterized protein n=1 Tax=Arundo donax TaxID=35708 RepID=A0A0A9CVX9_ARUDO